MFRLLTEDEIQDAEILGKAMRFGAMFAAGDPAVAGQLVWQPKKRVLELNLTEEGRGLYGEVSQARLAALAVSMKATVSIGRA
jgi:exopolyphosphatase/guanosine-5'-triphosphate,3'-diphosphate pyrophosphatase